VSSMAKQKKGRSRARYRDPNGRTRSVTFDRLVDARRFLAGMGGGLVRGEFVGPAQARTRFVDSPRRRGRPPQAWGAGGLRFRG